MPYEYDDDVNLKQLLEYIPKTFDRFTKKRIEELRSMTPEQSAELRRQGEAQAIDPFMSAEDTHDVSHAQRAAGVHLFRLANGFACSPVSGTICVFCSLVNALESAFMIVPLPLYHV